LLCVVQEQALLTKDSLSQNMEAIKRKYEVHMFRLFNICRVRIGGIVFTATDLVI